MNQIHRFSVISAVALTLAAGVTTPAQAMAPTRIEQGTVAGTGIVDRADGDAHLTLSHRCNRVATGWVRGTLRQRVGETFVAQSFVFRQVTCRKSSSDVSLGFRPFSDIAFGEGPATVSLGLRVCSGEPRTCSRRHITREVLLAFP
jgi:hypothetical protein